ncbi:MAG: O-antigen ligase family protein [Gallionella sp.]|nr:O-antigen ligase family protein [Gallionella sp.]
MFIKLFQKNELGMSQMRGMLFLEVVLSGLLFIYPTMMLVVKGGMNTVFIWTLFLAVSVFTLRPAKFPKVFWQHDWSLYMAAMFGLPLAILLSQVANDQLDWHPHDAASRYWLVLPIFLLLVRMPIRIFKVLQFAFPLAAIIGLSMIQDQGTGRWGISTLDLIHFGDFELIFGLMSLLAINWWSQDTWYLKLLKLTGFFAGLAASILSGTRGGWLMLPVFVLLLAYFYSRPFSFRKVSGSMLAAGVSLILIYSASPPFHQRVDETVGDLLKFEQGQKDTSTGVRWQLYIAAKDVFFQHPLVGVGPEGFGREMQAMQAAGKLTPLAAEQGRGEVHNDLLAKAAGMGLFGLLAILAIYIVPLRMFWRLAQASDGVARRSAIMGVVFVSGCITFGLTVELLNLAMATAFYSFTVAVLLAASYRFHDDGIVRPN